METAQRRTRIRPDAWICAVLFQPHRIDPLSGLFIKTSSLTWGTILAHGDGTARTCLLPTDIWRLIPGALINGFFGSVVAWVLVRYRFPGRSIVDALVDLPFALPTAVAGIALTAIYSSNGWIGRYLEPLGLKVAFTPLGVLVALTFIGLPFVVRTVQPVLQDLDMEVEEAATTLGANRWQTFRAVIMPELWPALLTGVAMAFARSVGNTVRSSSSPGNMPLKSEITPLLIMTKLEQYDYAGATALGVVMLVASFLLALISQFRPMVEQRSPHRSLEREEDVDSRRCQNQKRRVESLIDERTRFGSLGAHCSGSRIFDALPVRHPLAAVFTEALKNGLAALLRLVSGSGCLACRFA